MLFSIYSQTGNVQDQRGSLHLACSVLCVVRRVCWCVLVLVLVCHADPSHPSPRVYVRNAPRSKRPREYRHHARKCYPTRGRTHRFFFSVPQRHTHKTQQQPPPQQHTETGTDRDRERDRERKTEKERQRKRDREREKKRKREKEKERKREREKERREKRISRQEKRREKSEETR